ncbi:hypothetical protein pipiens_003063 [Culex pipiens pipiens]|uniref:Uncharacterized protein n=1 Tax=Culex pipiens pipiens TaxID=38569 RepID=A0ABD1D446_CULPP
MMIQFNFLHVVTSTDRNDGGKFVPFGQHVFNLRNGSTCFFQYKLHCLLISDINTESRMGSGNKEQGNEHTKGACPLPKKELVFAMRQ